MARSLSHPISVTQILELLGRSVIRTAGSTDRRIISASPIREALGVGAFTFWEGGGASEMIKLSKAETIICGDAADLDVLDTASRTLIIVSHPRLCFMRVLKRYFTEPTSNGIHPSAIIHPEAIVHASASIGPNTYVGRCRVGANAQIHGNVYLYDHTVLGESVVIQAGSVLGMDGFHFHQNETGDLEKFPHLGGVVVGDNVEVGSQVCIARGTLTDTLIGSGTKFDNLVHVAHTVTIGRRCRIGASATITGNVVIGDDVWVGPGAVVSNNLEVGDKANISLGSVVVSNVREGQRVSGNFAIEHRRFLAAQMNSFRQLAAAQ